MTSTLTTNPDYPINPGRELGGAFLAHVRITASPETFPGLSTTRPPETGDLAVLAHPVNIDGGRRPDGARVPCPICSPTSPKFLSGGTLIWCADTAAIYLVGPTCSTTGWMAKLDVARNAFAQSEQARMDGADLAAEAAAAAARLAWAAVAEGPAGRADEAQDSLAKLLPMVRRMINDQLKNGSGLSTADGRALGRPPGPEFFGTIWRNTGRMFRARDALLALKADAGADPVAWAAGLTPSLRAERLAVARGAVDDLKAVQAQVGFAAALMSTAGLDVIANWARGGGGPNGLTFSRLASGIDLRLDDKVWSARAGTVKPVRGVPPAPSVAEPGAF